MAKVFFARHQAGGVLYDYPFASPPTDAQLEPLRRMCVAKHGSEHAKTREPLWFVVIEQEMLGADDVPEVPDSSFSMGTSAGIGDFGVSGSGVVE